MHYPVRRLYVPLLHFAVLAEMMCPGRVPDLRLQQGHRVEQVVGQYIFLHTACDAVDH